jgi:hypothetical protein
MNAHPTRQRYRTDLSDVEWVSLYHRCASLPYQSGSVPPSL